MDEDSQVIEQLQTVDPSDREALAALLAKYRGRLLKIVQMRMDRRLRGRVDPSDVIQEAFLEASVRVHEYVRDAQAPFFVWLRFLTQQKLAGIHRRHLGTQARDPRREVSLYSGQLPAASSAALARGLLGRLTSPSQAAQRKERNLRLEEAMNRMRPIDREVLLLRHFEELSNQEAASVLEISPTAANNRYIRALKRLRELLLEMYGSAAENEL